MNLGNNHILFICSSFDGHLGCLPVLTIVNSVAMNIAVHVVSQTQKGKYFAYI